MPFSVEKNPKATKRDTKMHERARSENKTNKNVTPKKTRGYFKLFLKLIGMMT